MNILSYIQNNSYSQNKHTTNQLINLILKSNSSKQENIENDFISACLHYFIAEDSTELQEITHLFVEHCIVGKKDEYTLNTLFGNTVHLIQMILFDDNNEIYDLKKEFLSLIRFYVKTGYFDDILVDNDLFIKHTFQLLQHNELFVKTSTLLEAIFERRTKSFDITTIDSLKEVFHSISYLHLGVFFPVMNYLIHNGEDKETVHKNVMFLLNNKVIEKMIHMFSLSTVHLAIIYLVQNESIEESDQLVTKFKMNYHNDIEVFPEVNIHFEGIQGLYCADILTNMLFILSTMISEMETNEQKEEMINNSSICDVMSNLYFCLDVDTMKLEDNSQHRIFQSLFYQFVHLISSLPSSIILGSVDGLEFIDLILSDLEEDDLDNSIRQYLIGCLETIVRESTIEQKETLGTDKQFIQILLHILQHNLCESNENTSNHLIYDVLGSLLRQSQRNMKTFFSVLYCPLDIFLQQCVTHCIETSVFFRSLMLNVMHDKIDCGITGLNDTIEQYAKQFFYQLLVSLNDRGISSHTTCCLNTVILIIGLFSYCMDELIYRLNEEMKYTIRMIIDSFKMKYKSKELLKELCSITCTSEMIWESVVCF